MSRIKKRKSRKSARYPTAHCLTDKKNIALTGFMAAGKSVVGRRLAQRLSLPFIDLDRAIEKREGMKTAEIFARRGEPYFRKLEKEVLKNVLEKDGQVIATGGGVVADSENLRLIKEKCLLICLTAPTEVLLERSKRGIVRPLLEGGERKKRMESLLERRKNAYAQAEISIDTGALTVPEVVEGILKMLGPKV